MIIFASKNIFDPAFWSLSNTNLVVALAFIIFVGFLAWKGVPKIITGMLDKRANDIRAELEEAHNLREEAQALLAEYERKMAEVEKEAESIVKTAKKVADEHAKEAEAKLAEQVERRIASGKEQIAAAEASVERSIRTKAAAIAVQAAQEVLIAKTGTKDANALIDQAIADVDANLN